MSKIGRSGANFKIHVKDFYIGGAGWIDGARAAPHPARMSDAPFASRIRRHPVPFDPGAGRVAREVMAGAGAEVLALVEGVAGCSPYLARSIEAEAEWLRAVLGRAPEAAMEDTLLALGEVSPDGLATALRVAKTRTALLVALADCGGVWPLATVTGVLTRLADRAVDVGLAALLAAEIRRGKLPGAAPEDAGMVVLAMGKMGAGELNYSSDIDLICLFDETRYPGAVAEARAAFVRVTRKLCALLSDRTAEGYVFRTDLRLRPDASVTPVCLSMAAAEAYYESVGRTWERAAFIKARPCAGDIAAGTRFLTTLTPFVWRRHLDFAAIEDAHDMRLRIRDHRQLHGTVRAEGHDMKLGIGGIREIEFFTQTRQLIAGGRDPDLRARGTVEGLAALAAKGWVPGTVAEELTQLYRDHREVEHRLQMVGDAQTHEMPATDEGIARIAAFCGSADAGGWRAALEARLRRTDALTEGFFAPGGVEPGPDLPDAAKAIVTNWKTYPALRSDRAVAIFRRLRPAILTGLLAADHPVDALLAFDGFLKGLPAGVQLFAMFDANPQLIALIVDISATAPALAAYLSRNSSVLDAVIGGQFFAPWPGEEALTRELATRLERADGYETALDAARRWQKEWHFRIGVHHLRGLIGAIEAGTHYADLAAATLRAVWPVVCAEFAVRHGAAPGRGAVLIAMGSLGAGRLNAASDLDLIVIYDAAGEETSAGPRPLAARIWFARLTQAMITALQAPMAEGRLYEVDMRLRPSGRQGPVATAVTAFAEYQRTEAWTWEHLALTRARPLAGNATLVSEVEALRCQILSEKSDGGTVRADVAAMRTRLADAKPGTGGWEAKAGAGRLMEVELCAQMAALLSGSAARGTMEQVGAGKEAGILSQSDAQAMEDAASLCWRVTTALRLLGQTSGDPDGPGPGGRAFVLREAGAENAEALTAMLDGVAERSAAAIARVLEAGNE